MLAEALCTECQINPVKLDNKKADLCKSKPEGSPHKVVGCSCVVVKDHDKESQAKDDIEEYFKCKKQMSKNLVH